jgi:hypothetical protein
MPTKLNELIPFPEAGAFIPGHPTLSTLHRWQRVGCNGRKLRTVKIGRKRFVSPEAVQEFIAPDRPGRRYKGQ